MKKGYFSRNPVISDDDAVVIGNFIDSDLNGRPTPKEFFEKSKDPNSATHRFFEWDPSRAVEKLGIITARQLIASIYIQEENGTSMREYIHVEVDNGATYMSRDLVSKDEGLMHQVFERLSNELRRMQLRYQTYKLNLVLNVTDTKGTKHVIDGNEGKEAVSR